jgi:SSS family solute:Na+ symporter
MEIHEYLSTWDFVIVGVYILVLVGIGSWVSFRKKTSKEDNLFLAGRSLRWPSIGLTLWGTNVGPSMLIATAGIGYTSGLVAGNFSWYAFPFIILLAFLFAPLYRKTNVSTLPEFLGRRFNNTTRYYLALYSLITILVSWLALTLYAGGILVSQILNIPLLASILVLILLAAFFSIAGGLEAIAYTNVFQMILLILVSIAFVTIGLSKIGNLQEAFASTPDSYWKMFLPADDKNYPWLAIILGYPVLGVWFWCTDQSMVQSVLGAKNLKQSQLGTNLTAWLKILDVPLFILPGIICFLLYPGLEDPNEAYMTLVTRTLPVGMIGLIMAVLIAALVSTIDAALNSLSTIFTLDIIVKNKKLNLSQKKVVSIGRWVNVTGALIGVLLALLVAKIKGLDLFSLFQAILGFLAPPITTVFLVGVLWKKATARAANFILSFGALISFSIGILFLSNIPSKEFWPHFLMLSFFIFVGLTITMIIISLITSKKEEQNQAYVLQTGAKGDYKASRQVVLLWSLLVIAMVILYVVFN